MGVQRVIQKPWLCGPATLEMLFSWYGIKIDQEEIARATNLPARDLFRFGYSLYVLNRAIQQMDNGFHLLVKYDSSLEDLATLTRMLPVGVEWRCAFREPDGQIWGEGHYCVVESADLGNGKIYLIDPYYAENLSHQDGVVSAGDFEKAWWDENIMPGDQGEETQVWTQGCLFLVVPTDQVSRFAAYGLAPMSPQLAAAHQTPPRKIELPTPVFVNHDGE